MNSSVLSLLYGTTLTSKMTTGKKIALTIRTFVGKVMSLLFNMLPRLSLKVHLVKAMVFPVVMYGCESWTIKKA